MKKLMILIGFTCLLQVSCSFQNKPEYIGEYYNSYAPAMKYGNWGIVDTSGNTVLDFEYEYIQPFSYGMAGLCKNGKWGFIDSNLKMISGFIYDTVWPFYHQYAVVYDDEKYSHFCINHSGNKVGHDFIRPFETPFYFILEKKNPELYKHYGVLFKQPCEQPLIQWLSAVYSTAVDSCLVICDSSGWYVLGAAGKKLYGPFDDFRYSNKGHLVIVAVKDKYTMIGLDRIIDCAWYQDIGNYTTDTLSKDKSYGPDDLALGIATMGLYTFLKHKDKEEEIRKEYTYFSEGMLAVKKNNLYGYIDTTGKLIIPAVFSVAGNFAQGKAKVKRSGREFYIDIKGNEIR